MALDKLEEKWGEQYPIVIKLVKLVYLAYRNARKKWTMPVPNWGIISQQLAIKFEDRYNLL